MAILPKISRPSAHSATVGVNKSWTVTQEMAGKGGRKRSGTSGQHNVRARSRTTRGPSGLDFDLCVTLPVRQLII